jgi:lipopolysaccharide/colanic/teichoic acid biosynthesis glycosyltransferase
VVLAAIALVASAPAMGVIALLIAVTMGRPVLFRQQRVGLHGVEFSMIKFRTMRPEAYPGQPDSERKTRTGAVLRLFSLDELPQLVNILRGDMSIVGPRPALPEHIPHYSPEQHGRLIVRPGLTGWAQINGRNTLTIEQRIAHDLWYIENRSGWLDLRIMFATVLCVLWPRGVVGEGGVNPNFPVAGEDRLIPGQACGDRQAIQ